MSNLSPCQLRHGRSPRELLWVTQYQHHQMLVRSSDNCGCCMACTRLWFGANPPRCQSVVAGGIAELNMDSSGATGALDPRQPAAAAAPRPKRPAARKKPVVVESSDDEDYDCIELR